MDIYRERKRLGDNLVHPILKAVGLRLESYRLLFYPEYGRGRLFRDAGGVEQLFE